jgi:hypothetical protein
VAVPIYVVFSTALRIRYVIRKFRHCILGRNIHKIKIHVTAIQLALQIINNRINGTQKKVHASGYGIKFFEIKQNVYFRNKHQKLR